MTKGMEMIKTTVAGGVVFLLPIIVVLIVLGKGLEIAHGLSQPLIEAVGIETVAGVAFGTIVAVLVMVLVAFLAGLLAQTALGQATFASLENSIVGVLPQLRMARGVVQSFDTENAPDVEVVLVPTDAGWCLGFVLERPDGEWWSVFVPGAPQWTAGAVVYAHSDQVRHTGLTFSQAIVLMRRCGAGSDNIRSLLNALHEKGEL